MDIEVVRAAVQSAFPGSGLDHSPANAGFEFLLKGKGARPYVRLYVPYATVCKGPHEVVGFIRRELPKLKGES